MAQEPPHRISDWRIWLAHWRDRVALIPRDITPRSIVLGVAAVVVLSLVMLPFREELGVLNVLLLYLLLTFSLALTVGLWAAVISALLGFLAFDLAFIPPYQDFTVARPDHVLALFVYLGVAIVTARLVSRTRERTEAAQRESRRMALLAELNAALISDVTLDAILERIVERVVTIYGAQGCRVLLAADDGALRVHAAFPAALDTPIDRADMDLAEWAMSHRQPIGRSQRGRKVVGLPKAVKSTHVAAPGDLLFLPLQSASHVSGVLEVIGRPGQRAFHAEDEQLLTTFVDQAALALERARLAEEAAQSAVLARSDELKSALLSAVSHDLRTPLASIKAAVTSLLDDSIAWDSAVGQELLEAIDEETDRLTLMVGNLLDLSRIEGGALRPQKDWYDIGELIADVRARLSGRMRDHPLVVQIDDDLPILPFDYIEIAQVLTNLIENAVKYTPSGTSITVSARRLPGAIEVAVHDGGDGIPLNQQDRIFEKFYRAPGARAPGTGIGLAISKGLVEAHGGKISVVSGQGAGTTFRFSLPLDASGAELPEIARRQGAAA